MSKKFSAEELLKHTNDALKSLTDVIVEFRESSFPKLQKRAALLGYWIRTYAKYLKKEDTFSPTDVFRLKRGAIVSVEFGYRVGAEIGGKHYAVILDVNNDYHSGVVTVLPLGSTKENSKNSRHTLILEDGIFTPLYNKLMTLVLSAKNTLKEIEDKDNSVDSLSPEEAASWKIVRRNKIKDAENLLASCLRQIDEIQHLKAGSIAHLSQVTTISKMRILSPLEKTDALYGVRLSDADLNMIDKALKDRFFR